MSPLFTRGGAYRLTRIALFGALLCLLCPWSLPLSGGVPLSLGSFAVLLAGLILGPREGAAAVLLYLVLGALGLPVFSGLRGGAGILFGPTGGFLLGYLPLAFFPGLFRKKGGRLLGILLGEGALYLLGTLWFAFSAKADLWQATAACVLPFLPGDAAKAALAWGMDGLFRKRFGRKDQSAKE